MMSLNMKRNLPVNSESSSIGDKKVSVQLDDIELNHFCLHHENGDTAIDERQRIR